jgi:transcriptional regulator with XRE-family HTH domain
LAEASGITPNYIGAIEIGKRDPGLSTVLKIARGLRITPGELGLPELPAMAIEAGKLDVRRRRAFIGRERTRARRAVAALARL